LRSGKTLVLLSGGLDSAVALAWALRRGEAVLTVSFSFPGRPRAEAAAARRIANASGLTPPRVIRVPVLHMTGSPEGAPGRRDAPPGFVPHRNLVYYSLALAAAAEAGATRIIGGHLKTDGESFADARPAFFGALSRLASRGKPPGTSCRIVLPFATMTKAACLRLGVRLGVRLGLTWSCYRDGPRPCGACAGCAERREAFRAAGMDDEAGFGESPRRRSFGCFQRARDR
jgi:7-cyano-7-deazaguanine synthase